LAGETTTGSLSGALPSIIASARIIKEFDGVWQRTCEKATLATNSGLTWQEYSVNAIEAQDITETSNNTNAQQLSGQLLTSTPQMTQILVKVSDRTKRRLSSNVLAKIGSLAGNAMKRKKDEDYLSLFASFATTASPGTGNPLSFGHITAAVANAMSNATEGAEGAVHAVLHGFQIKDLQDEIVAGVGTYTVPVGMTEEIYRRGWAGTVAGANVWKDDNITITATPDANGAVHATMGVVAVQGMSIKTETRRDPAFGGGADEVFMTDEYSFIERTSGTTQVFCYRMLTDATAPTS
jgi:hypothetical protein